MRPPILRALLRKEFDRHLANRGGLALAGLLVVAALLLAAFDPTGGGGGAGGGGAGAAETGGLVGGVHHCYLFYHRRTPLIDVLDDLIPPHLRNALVVKEIVIPNVEAVVRSSPGVGAILVDERHRPDGRPELAVEIWHPEGDPAAMAGYEQWLWRAVRVALQANAEAEVRGHGVSAAALPPPPADADDLWAVREAYRNLAARVDELRGESGRSAMPEVTIRRKGTGGQPLDLRGAIATAMVIFALYFACVYLLPVLTCEERERGVLLAQALSPATPAEILAAKFLFYPALGVGLAATLAGIYRPGVLLSPFFWLAIAAVAAAFLGIGMTIASLARTQRAAFLGSMCYLMAVALFLMICQQNAIPFLPYLAVEFHGPRVLHAALVGDTSHYRLNVVAAGLLAFGWLWAAVVLFRRRGWQ